MDQPPNRSHRLGIADIAAAYGTEALHHRIAQLRACGQHYAAVAIEHEIRAVPEFRGSGERNQH
ncbi:hypothetical protein [Nocardia bovistercoris]|uniref:Uncharacterized protein n=1 Tax=Nocardia bovistercoris TaxID=2785916 RepID=A0A931IGD2_9NOCA|nr:hypothetical protein [Nocardia bovistercoris]MBH0779178.1 hypothetical protein [Nocardia bovistercoris]